MDVKKIEDGIKNAAVSSDVPNEELKEIDVDGNKVLDSRDRPPTGVEHLFHLLVELTSVSELFTPIQTSTRIKVRHRSLY